MRRFGLNPYLVLIYQLFKQSNFRYFRGVGGGRPVKFTGATGSIPVTYNNNIKHLALLDHKRITNAVDLHIKNKKKLWGMPCAREPCHRLWYIYNYPDASAVTSPPSHFNVIWPVCCLSSALSLKPSGCICLICLSL